MKTDLRRTWAEIDLDALRYNYETIRAHVGEGVRFLGVVKADAYGHGAVVVAEALESWGADMLAVSSMDEAKELRLAGIGLPILILGYTPVDQVAHLIRYDILQAVGDLDTARAYEEKAAEAGGILRIHIKLDTGMTRLGFSCHEEMFAESLTAAAEAVSLPHLKAEGIFTHFALSDEEGEEAVQYTELQFSRFRAMIAALEEKSGKTFAIHHCANTGATADWKKTAWDMVRPGLLLYGYGDHAKKLGLRPVMRLKTCVSVIRSIKAGSAVSYGGVWKAERDSRLAVVPIGYADGFHRVLSNRWCMAVNGKRIPIRGRICMDMCMLDVTDLPEITAGEEITVFGPGAPIEEMAEMAGTIPYELTCAVSRRVPRVYIREGKKEKTILHLGE